MPQLLSSLPVGAKVKDLNTKYYGKPIIFQVIDKNHPGYPANSVTLLTEKIITLKAFDAKEPSNPNTDRQSYGNNRYAHSNIRQWLNKDTSPWYAAQHGYDAPPNNSNVWSNYNEYEAEAGFLSNFSAELKSKLLVTTLSVAKNTVTDGGGSETIQDKVFLLSETEVGLGNENGIAEGTPFSFFSSDAARQAYPTVEAVSNSEYTNTSLNASQPWYWWLRTPHAGFAYYARYVYSSGALTSDNAFNGTHGVRPALNLPSDILVSDSTDADGAYIIVWNQTPTISGTDADLGSKSAPFTIDYIVNDTDTTDTLTITEKVDTTVIRTINNAVRNQTYTLDVSSVWNTLALGAHTITITIDDGKGGTATRTYTFTKTDDRIKFTLKNPIETSIAAKKIVVSGVVTIPNGATLSVKACNNGFDTSPTWEDITTAFLNRQAYTFTNTTKTAEKWGINIQFEILKGTATDQIIVDGFGFSFE
ncbi:IgA protease [Geobacillus proteiniphilus]|uniref:IgA protease n=1 Tax=Geobacillus proteiniphilus TaxID=860353 RepID=A0A1Q5STS7_9BACL|nr:DUF6273 domain-containing protein [Geobacillus proteiniphilus]OKO91409.1 IgA protease [Geobacillus proteiniphilus]